MRFVLTLFLLALATQGSAMAFFGKSTQVYLASPLEGVLYDDGRPVGNARMVRVIGFGGEDIREDEIVTDAEGGFSFSEAIKEMNLSPLNELVISQKISVYYGEKDHLVWIKSKRVPEIYGELSGRPTNFRCDLAKTPVRVDQGRGLLQTSCEWDSIEKQGE